MADNYTFDPETGSFFSTPRTASASTATSIRAEELADIEAFDDFQDIMSGSTAPDALYPPETFSITGQTVRTNPDGSTVVDVIVEVADGSDAQEYEVRLTK